MLCGHHLEICINLISELEFCGSSFMGQCSMRQGLLASAHMPAHFPASLKHVLNHLLLSSTQQPLRAFTTPPQQWGCGLDTGRVEGRHAGWVVRRDPERLWGSNSPLNISGAQRGPWVNKKLKPQLTEREREQVQKIKKKLKKLLYCFWNVGFNIQLWNWAP